MATYFISATLSALSVFFLLPKLENNSFNKNAHSDY